MAEKTWAEGKKRGRRKPKRISGPFQYNPNTVYFYADGCLKERDRRYGSWSTFGIECEVDPKTSGQIWREIFTSSASHVPARCSGQMELRAIIAALDAATRDYLDKAICIRTDHTGHQETIFTYLGTYKYAYRDQDAEDKGAQERASLRRKANNSKIAADYEELFNLLDIIGIQGRHHNNKLSVEWISRTGDDWIKQADTNAREANLAFSL